MWETSLGTTKKLGEGERRVQQKREKGNFWRTMKVQLDVKTKDMCLVDNFLKRISTLFRNVPADQQRNKK